MTAADKSITAEELLSMGDIGRCELINGEIIRMAPAGPVHGRLTKDLTLIIGSFVKERSLGEVYVGDTGFIISRNPDTVRAPDLAFVASSSTLREPRRGFFEGAPDLALEVLSPNDTAAEAAAKTEQWLSSGARSVWVVDPQSRNIAVHRPNQPVVRYVGNDELRDEPLLPGLVIKLSDVFGLP